MKIPEDLLAKVAVMAVASCTWAVAPSLNAAADAASSGLSVLAILGVAGMRAALRRNPDYEAAFVKVLKNMPREFEFANDATEKDTQECAAALTAALDLDGLFSLPALKHAMARQGSVVAALTDNALEALAKADKRFANEGMPLDMARDLLGRAFAVSLEECQSLRERVGFKLLEADLSETRAMRQAVDRIEEKALVVGRLEEKMDAMVAQVIKTSGASEALLRSILSDFGDPIPADGLSLASLEYALRERAKDYRALSSRLSASSGTEVTSLQQSASKALANGDLAGANVFLEQADRACREALTKLAGAVSTQRNEAIDIAIAMGDLARYRFKYEDAVEHYRAAMRMMGTLNTSRRWQTALRLAECIYFGAVSRIDDPEQDMESAAETANAVLYDARRGLDDENLACFAIELELSRVDHFLQRLQRPSEAMPYHRLPVPLDPGSAENAAQFIRDAIRRTIALPQHVPHDWWCRAAGKYIDILTFWADTLCTRWGYRWGHDMPSALLDAGQRLSQLPSTVSLAERESFAIQLLQIHDDLVVLDRSRRY